MKYLASLGLASLFCASSLGTLPAMATLEDNLSPFPQGTSGMMSVNLDLKKWKTLADQKAIKNLLKDVMKKAKESKSKNKVDLFNALLTVGSNATLGFYPRSGEEFDILMSLNIKSQEHAKVFLKQVLEMSEETGVPKAEVSSFGGYKIYHLPFKIDKELPEHVNIAVSPKNILLSLGNDQRILKNMLYIESVLKGPAKAKHSSSPLFKQALAEVGDQSLWLYIDIKNLLSIFEGSISDPEMKGLLSQDSYQFSQVISMGMDLKEQGLFLNSFSGFDRASLNQKELKYITALLGPSQKSQAPITHAIGDTPLMAAVGDKLDVVLNNMDLIMESLKKSSPDVYEMMQEFGKEFKTELTKHTQLDLDKDILSQLDGRQGLAMYLPKAKDKMLPETVIYLGLKNKSGHNLTHALTHKMEFKGNALAEIFAKEFGGAQKRAKGSSVKANAHTLQTIVETYAVDSGGAYPTDVLALSTEAKKNSSPYWKELTNPFTKKQGVNQSYMDFSKFNKNADQIGTVFYRPMGKAKLIKGKKIYTEYIIYGWTEEGTLFQLSNMDNLAKQPISFAKNPSETYAGYPIYTLAQKDLFKDLAEFGNISPALTQIDDILLVSSSVEALKAAIDQSQNKKPNLTQSHNLKKAQHLMGNPNPDSFFVFDLKQLIQKGLKIEGFDKSTDGKKWRKALSPIGSMHMSTKNVKNGSIGHFFFELDMKHLDVEEIMRTLNEKPRSLAKNSSVKANMHTIQTIVETYGVDWGGYYAPNMAALHLDATTSKAGKYWKNQNNPYSGKSTKPSDWVIDYSEYKKEKSQAGMVLYAPKVPSKGRVASYWIYGVDHNGELIKDRGQVLTLSNS